MESFFIGLLCPLLRMNFLLAANIFNGLELPDAVLALDAVTKEAILFVPVRDARFDGSGRPMGWRVLLGTRR